MTTSRGDGTAATQTGCRCTALWTLPTPPTPRSPRTRMIPRGARHAPVAGCTGAGLGHVPGDAGLDTPNERADERRQVLSAALFLWGKSGSHLLPCQVGPEAVRASLTGRAATLAPEVLCRLSSSVLLGHVSPEQLWTTVCAHRCAQASDAQGKEKERAPSLPAIEVDAPVHDAGWLVPMVQKDPELMMSPDRVKQRNHSSPGDSPRKSSGKSTRTAWLARLLRSGSFKRMSDSWERGYPSDKTLLQLVQASEAEDTCKQHQQRCKKSVAEYVPWMLPAGEGDLGAHTRRQLVMDKIGGLARSLGRPGSRTEQTGRSASRNAGNISDCASDGTDESEGRSGGQAAGAGPSGQGGSPSRVSRTKNAFQHLRQGLQHLKRKCANRSELTSHYVLFGIATPVVLFGFDAYYLMSPDPASDEIMLTVVVCVLWMLLVEFLCTCACTTAYVGSFFFYCDLVAIVSMVPEVLMLFLVDVTSVTAVFDLARAGRAARAGTRVSRLVRLITSLTAWRKAHPSDPRDVTSQVSDTTCIHAYTCMTPARIHESASHGACHTSMTLAFDS